MFDLELIFQAGFVFDNDVNPVLESDIKVAFNVF